VVCVAVAAPQLKTCQARVDVVHGWPPVRLNWTSPCLGLWLDAPTKSGNFKPTPVPRAWTNDFTRRCASSCQSARPQSRSLRDLSACIRRVARGGTLHRMAQKMNLRGNLNQEEIEMLAGTTGLEPAASCVTVQKAIMARTRSNMHKVNSATVLVSFLQGIRACCILVHSPAS
jgi:hypothetical protein